MGNYVITVARGFGSKGREIAHMLADELHIPCYDHQILQMASDYSGISEQLFSEVDEKLRAKNIRRLLTGVPASTLLTHDDKEFTSDDNLFNIQAEIIRSQADAESCVIVGKCADYILRERKNVISIYVDAPRACCVKTVMNRLKVDETEAHRLIHRIDKYRSDYYHYYTGGLKWTNMNHYDYVINTGRVEKAECIEMLKGIVKRRFLIQENLE